ncbi:hypothetical protein COEREDRAFT_82294 [Coemansia reversa NRRL 1564]|uniref:Uncharacterized protein n=1 Tax=Coemansia reversa (strain ATCC 12441 / NRRL 1564) TaxID=763665 RepID=A0A2G5B7W9_COERN|nr:hypothetical protein COEREDRAFT_82294 [Coemansia reversa NRRL 1564]|eukprot:PIA15091.1 hypothetical protein COEREDRAFT_82294 [Coemansia reversa NRRL 1564]
MRNELQPRRRLSAASTPARRAICGATAEAAARAAAEELHSSQHMALSLQTHMPQAVRPLAAASSERSMSYSAPTSPFLPRGAMHASRNGPLQDLRNRVPLFGGQEAALPLLAGPLSQQVSPSNHHANGTIGASHATLASQSEACSPRDATRRRSFALSTGFGTRAHSVGSTTQRYDGSDEDEDDSDLGQQSGGSNSDCDFDSMALDGADARRQSEGSGPRNKAFERLRSLVDEDRMPLAAEMEHEGHITRSIRHSSVQEWLRSASPAMASPPLDDPTTKPPLPRAPPARTVRDIPEPISFPASPAESAMSSPRLSAAAASCPNTAYPVPTASAVRLGKRKSLETDFPSDSSASATRPLHAYKRQAMSPSGLRAQIAIGKATAKRPRAPIAVPVTQASSSAGACPPLPLRSRSRSNASQSLTGLSIVQTNGVFSRMNISNAEDAARRPPSPADNPS